MRIYQRGYFKVYSAWNSLSLIQTSISVGSISFSGRRKADLRLPQSFGFLACSFVLAQRIVAGNMEVGNYVTFVNYLAQIYGPLNQVSEVKPSPTRPIFLTPCITSRSQVYTVTPCATCMCALEALGSTAAYHLFSFSFSRPPLGACSSQLLLDPSPFPSYFRGTHLLIKYQCRYRAAGRTPQRREGHCRPTRLEGAGGRRGRQDRV